MVNGPEDPSRVAVGAAGWEFIDWLAVEREVRRLRQRIFKATREGDWPTVRSLQKLMVRSRANTLLSVRQVTQRNAGRKTAGIDGEVALTSQDRAKVVVRVHHSISSWQPRAVKRVNVALHGPEEAAGVKYRTTGTHAGEAMPNSPALVRYADLCRCRHKSHYADYRIMPSVGMKVLVSGGRGGLLLGIIRGAQEGEQGRCRSN